MVFSTLKEINIKIHKMIQYKPFVDYKSDTVSNKLLSPSQTYWYNLDDVLK